MHSSHQCQRLLQSGVPGQDGSQIQTFSKYPLLSALHAFAQNEEPLKSLADDSKSRSMQTTLMTDGRSNLMKELLQIMSITADE